MWQYNACFSLQKRLSGAQTGIKKPAGITGGRGSVS
jgi:hypothetical protein